MVAENGFIFPLHGICMFAGGQWSRLNIFCFRTLNTLLYCWRVTRFKLLLGSFYDMLFILGIGFYECFLLFTLLIITWLIFLKPGDDLLFWGKFFCAPLQLLCFLFLEVLLVSCLIFLIFSFTFFFFCLIVLVLWNVSDFTF